MSNLLCRTACLRAIVCACLVLSLVAGLFIAPVRAQGNSDIAVVVNAALSVDNLSLADLRRILLGDREFWPSGERVTLLIRAPIARERDVAVQQVCKMTEAEFRRYWIGKVFRAETPSGPKIVYSAQMALDQVSRTPGAITFIEASAVGRGQKIVKIDGKSPGQAGYAVK